MELGAKTKIDDLLREYPFLLDFLTHRAPQFKLLQSSMMRNTVGKVATLTQVSNIGGIGLDQLLAELAGRIKAETGEEVRIAGNGSGSELEAKQEVLKGIIRDLHKGVDMATLKKRFHDLVREVDPSEIAKMEQRLIEEGMPESEIKRLCDVHVEVFRASLEKKEAPSVPPGHPIHTFMEENRAAELIMDEIALIMNKICDSHDTELFEGHRKELRALMERLSDIDLHYLRKENQFFPVLETHGIAGPAEVMWAIHDDVRKMLRTAKSRIAEGKAPEASDATREALKTIRDMIYKEEHILFPMALEILSEPDWAKVKKGEEEVGYAWIRPEKEWEPEAEPPAAPVSTGAESIPLTTGHLTPEQVNLIFTHLPVELSFVNERDEVEYYSQTKERIFPRSPGVIGRKVQNCHPPKSLHMVQKILDEFRAGKKDVADFWIEMKGRFISIRYFAVRDKKGNYKGTLEVVQNATDIKKLSGEKRLLDWE
ncbi:MAG TPA: DUF438 domain-containing protein [Dissulfurispiraceae bacterium]